MPGDFLIVRGDMIKGTLPPPTIAPVLPGPGELTRAPLPPPTTVPVPRPRGPPPGRSRKVLVGGKPICLEGDELPPALRSPLPYTAPPFVIPGTGTLEITLLPTNKTAQT